jgi:hypothetical protein
MQWRIFVKQCALSAGQMTVMHLYHESTRYGRGCLSNLAAAFKPMKLILNQEENCGN